MEEPLWLHAEELLAQDAGDADHRPAPVGLLGLDVPRKKKRKSFWIFWISGERVRKEEVEVGVEQKTGPFNASLIVSSSRLSSRFDFNFRPRERNEEYAPLEAVSVGAKSLLVE